MKRRVPESRIKPLSVFTVQVTDTFPEVVKLFLIKKIEDAPVLEGQEIVGTISRSKINQLTYHALFDPLEGTNHSALTLLTMKQIMTPTM